MAISAIVLTKNSEKTLAGCLATLKWCDEIIVIDDNSIDNTLEIAQKYTKKVLRHSLNNNFSRQRNFGLEKATGEWVLFVDSDEVVTPSLRDEICKNVNMQKSKYNGFYIKRVDYMWGKKLEHGEAGNIWLLRLAKKNFGKWEGSVHELWQVSGNNGRLSGVLDHFPHPTVSSFLFKINYYSTLRAQELYKKNTLVKWYDVILYPKAKFWVNYIVKLGFRDGIPGFLVAVLMSFHSFLVRGKLWQLQNTHD